MDEVTFHAILEPLLNQTRYAFFFCLLSSLIIWAFLCTFVTIWFAVTCLRDNSRHFMTDMCGPAPGDVEAGNVVSLPRGRDKREKTATTTC